MRDWQGRVPLTHPEPAWSRHGCWAGGSDQALILAPGSRVNSVRHARSAPSSSPATPGGTIPAWTGRWEGEQAGHETPQPSRKKHFHFPSRCLTYADPCITLVLAGADERELGQEASTPPWPQAPSQEKVQQPRGPNLSDLLHEMVTRPRDRDPGPREGPLRVLAEEQTSNAQIWGVGQAPGVAIYLLGSFWGAQI